MSLVAARTLRAHARRVLRVPVDVGDRVEPGQLLAEMDPLALDERLRALDVMRILRDMA